MLAIYPLLLPRRWTSGSCLKFSQVSFSSSFNGVMVVLVKIYGGRALPCQDGNEIVYGG
jgi:hypothetical protein